MSTTSIVTNYYQTILNRTPTSDEVTAWSNLIDQGILTANDVLADFVNCPEAQQNVVPVVELYQALFGRVPDQAGLQAWVGAEEGQSLPPQQLAQDFLSSSEGQAIYGSGTDISVAFLSALYKNVLNREPDTAGLNAWLSQNGVLSRAEVVVDFINSQEAQADLNPLANQFLTAAGQNLPTAYDGSLYTHAQGNTVTLTTGVDKLNLTGDNNVVSGTANAGILTGAATYNPGDQIIGAAGSTGNELDLTDLSGGDLLGIGGVWSPTSVPGVLVSNIQTVYLNSQEAVAVNTANSPDGFAGVTDLIVNFSDQSSFNSVMSSTITAAGTTTISAEDFGLSDATDHIEGGSDINYVADADDGGTIKIGDTTAPTGSISVTANVLAGQSAGDIRVFGGTTVMVTENLATDKNSGTTDGGDVYVKGGTLTTSVTVSQTAPSSRISNGSVEIYDANSTLATPKAGTITDVSLSNYDEAYIADNALANLTLAGTGDGLFIDAGNFASPSTTLNLTLNGLTDTHGIDDSYHNELKEIDITTGGTVASSLAAIYDTGLKTLTVTGSQSLSIGNEIDSLTAVAVSGDAGLRIILGPNAAFTSTSTGTDVVTIAASATKPIIGNGTADEELVWNGATAPATNADLGNASGFSVLGIGSNVASAASQTFDMSKITGFSGFDVQGGNTTANTISLTNVTAGTPLAIDGNFGDFQDPAPTSKLVYNTADTNGATDSLALTLGTVANKNGITVTGLVLGDSTASDGIGTLSVTSNASAAGAVNTIDTLVDPGLSTLNVSGTGGLAIVNLFMTSASSLTINGSETGTAGITFGGISSDSSLKSLTVSGSDAVKLGGLTESAASLTLTNSGSSTLDVGVLTDAALKSLTLNGNVAADLMGDTVATGVTVNGATDDSAVTVNMSLSGAASGETDSITLGNGTDSVFDRAAAGATVNIVVGNGGDNTTANIIQVGDANSTIRAGSGVNTITVGNGSNTITVGDGNDNITVGAGLNSITVGAGTHTLSFLAPGSTGLVFSTVSGAQANDKIALPNGGTSGAFDATQVTLSSTAAFSDYLNAAALASNAGGGAEAWFQSGGNTYVVANEDGASVFTAGTDYVVGLSGLHDLGNSTLASGTLTLGSHFG